MPPKDPKKLALWRQMMINIANRMKNAATPTVKKKRGRPKVNKDNSTGKGTRGKKSSKKNTSKKNTSMYDKLNVNINPLAQKFGVMDAVTAPFRWPVGAGKWMYKNPWKTGGLGVGAYNVGDYMGWWGPNSQSPNQMDVSNTDQIITNDSSMESTNLKQTDDFKGFDRRGGKVRRGGQRRQGGTIKKMGGVPGMSKGGSSLVKINGNWVRK
jgi:hypothetical protein